MIRLSAGFVRKSTLCRRAWAKLPLLAGLAALATAACGRVPGQFEILNNQVPTAGCTIPTDPTVYSGEGRLDLAIINNATSSAYEVFPLIENNLPASTSGVDNNQIVLSGFTVDITAITSSSPAVTALFSTLNGDPNQRGLLHFQVPWSGSVASGGGKISALVEAFPMQLAAQIVTAIGSDVSPALTVDLQIQALGRTVGGSGMQSDPFDYPVNLCVGCLVANVGTCPFSAAPSNTGNPCNPAQDDPVDCCTGELGLICPPTVAQQ